MLGRFMRQFRCWGGSERKWGGGGTGDWEGPGNQDWPQMGVDMLGGQGKETGLREPPVSPWAEGIMCIR